MTTPSPRDASRMLLDLSNGDQNALLTIEETAEAVGVSTATVTRRWRLARAWLYRQIKKGATGDE